MILYGGMGHRVLTFCFDIILTTLFSQSRAVENVLGEGEEQAECHKRLSLVISSVYGVKISSVCLE